MMTVLSRALSALALVLALTACTAPNASQSERASPATGTSPWRSWTYDDGKTRSASLTLLGDGNAALFIRGPAVSVPHWGELDYPEKRELLRVRQVGDRTFLIFEDARVAEMAERSEDHLFIWFRRVLNTDAEVDGQLRALPPIQRAPDLDLTLIPARDLPAGPDALPAPTNRFAI